MPRIATSLIRRAHKINPFLPHLLKPCRDLGSARNELRWLGQHVQRLTALQGRPKPQPGFLKQLVLERARGRPLQYILGSEYFGELEVFCQAGVLIPRPETADVTTALAERLLRNAYFEKPDSLPPHLRVLDLCSGSGCVSLLLSYILTTSPAAEGVSFQPSVRALGVDLSRRAVDLARANYHHMVQSSQLLPDTARANFVRGDVLGDGTLPVPTLSDLLAAGGEEEWDVLVCNPPYISPRSYWSPTTTRSVRSFEPRLALVPPPSTTPSASRSGDRTMVAPADGDSFYPRLFDVARDVGAKVILLEVGESTQAERVAKMAVDTGLWDGVEIWRDGVGVNAVFASSDRPGQSINDKIRIYGNEENQGRAVVCWRGEGAGWMSLT